jgi:thiamine phosphate synthase YjbQ (UPF0047 family)
MFIGVALAGASSVAASKWAESHTAASAMKHGYIQVVYQHTSAVLWVKDDKAEATEP